MSVRILGQIYEAMGVRAMPVVVSVSAMNKLRREQVQKGEQPVQGDGSFGILIPHHYEKPEDWQHNDGPWPAGHIALVAQGRYLVDPSADQLAYPDFDLNMTPLTLDLDPYAEEFITEGQAVAFRTPEDGEVVYHPFPDDLSYMESQDWKGLVPGEPLFDRVFEQVTGLVDLAVEADQLPRAADLPVAIRHSQVQTPGYWVQAVRSGIELGQIEPTATAIVDFLADAHVPSEVAKEIVLPYLTKQRGRLLA